ncbi:MAG: hypothetical protein R3224_01315 [Balneolaceae bacterium]|nr:hypothetical protein [Balneolaceae bacterium]
MGFRGTMNKFGLTIFFTLAIFAITSAVSYAQFREHQNATDYSGPVVKDNRKSAVGNWANLFNMKMSHSYSMNFMSAGGQFQNINAYTNSMDFFFSDRLTGELDISLLHSPFGNSYLNGGNNSLGAEIVIRNAELNYRIGERSHISLQFQQHPYGFGYSRWGSPFYRGPFDY